jgi:PAS domain S-box-containing protein
MSRPDVPSRRRAFDVQAEIARLFAEADPRGAIPYVEVCRGVATLLKDGAAVRLLDERGTHLVTVASWHPDPALRELFDRARGAPLPIAADPTGAVLHSRNGRLVPHLALTPEVLAALPDDLRAVFVARPPHSLVVAPLRAGGREIGVLLATRDATPEPFVEHELELLEDIALSTAHALTGLQIRAELEAERARSLDAATSEHRLRIVVDALPALVSFVDPDLRYRFVNRAYTEWFGTPIEDLVGKTLPEALGESAFETIRPHVEAALAGESVHYSTEIPYAGGSRFVDASYTPDRAPDGSIRGFVALVLDVTATRRAEERVAAVTLAADRAKDEFLAMLAHELRNPLAPLLSGLQLLRRGEGDPAARPRLLETMERQTRHLARLVDDLLDVSRITSGRIELRRAPHPLGHLIERAIEAVRPLVDQHGHTISVDVADDLVVDVDPVRLEQVLSNLLDNAAKYTDPGGRIGIAAERDGEQVVIRVSDDGIGMSADVLSDVFQPFRQATVSIDRARGGLGLGLAVVRKLVERHGGSVEAHSDGRGRGSTFAVRLPIASSPVRAVDPAPPSAVTPRRVLVVDDNTDAADAILELLDAFGHEVRVANDGPQALTLLDAFPADVVLLDLGLPDMDGYEVARAMRERGAQIRIVALSGYGRAEDRTATKRAGFDAHLVKPVDVETLLASLER